MVSQVRTGVDIETLLAYGSAWVEVVDGQIIEVEMAASYSHVVIIDNLFRLLDTFVRQGGLGRVHTDGLTYILHQDDDGIQTTRIPDFSFIRRENIPPRLDRDRPFPGAPDLAVEIVSPYERTETLMRKVSDYLRYGSQQVWAIYPQRRVVVVYQAADNAPLLYAEGDTLTAEALFPGLRLPVTAIFAED